MENTNDSLQAIQIIVQLSIVLVGIGLQWGIMKANNSAIRKEIDVLRDDMDREITDLKNRDFKMEDKIQLAMQNQSEMKATLASMQSQQQENFRRLFDKLEKYDENINSFYKRYGKGLEEIRDR